MRLALAQIESLPDDHGGNLSRLVRAYQSAREEGAELVIFPELAVCGGAPHAGWTDRRFAYATEDTLLSFASECEATAALVGTPEHNPRADAAPLLNAAAFCQHGVVQEFARKQRLRALPDCDERQCFAPGDPGGILWWGDRRIAVTLGDDLAATTSIETAVDLVINMSICPISAAVMDGVRKRLRALSARCECPAVWVNAVGSAPGLQGGGGSFALDAAGQVLVELPAGQEQIETFSVKT